MVAILDSDWHKKKHLCHLRNIPAKSVFNSSVNLEKIYYVWLFIKHKQLLIYLYVCYRENKDQYLDKTPFLPL